MEILRIDWKTGRMDLIVKKFFPCPLRVARKIASLINRHCAAATKAELLSELRDMVEFYQEEVRKNEKTLIDLKSYYAAMGSMAVPDLKAMKHCEVEIRKNEALMKRLKRNIELIERGMS